MVPAYGLSYHKLALLYVAPVVGGALGIPIGHYLFDLVGKLWARRANGIVAPEARLIPLWLVLPLKIAGYNMIGQSIGHRWSIWVLAVGWGMHNLATILTTTAVGAYLIDAYPEAAGESAAWLNFARTVSGFAAGYFHINWGVAMGVPLEYGIQTAIMGGAFLVFVVPLTVWGRRIRELQGHLKFATN